MARAGATMPSGGRRTLMRHCGIACSPTGGSTSVGSPRWSGAVRTASRAGSRPWVGCVGTRAVGGRTRRASPGMDRTMWGRRSLCKGSCRNGRLPHFNITCAYTWQTESLGCACGLWIDVFRGTMWIVPGVITSRTCVRVGRTCKWSAGAPWWSSERGPCRRKRPPGQQAWCRSSMPWRPRTRPPVPEGRWKQPRWYWRKRTQ
mmetsp:Transcript_90373/g.206635  ORF Transcript_90373/g.206635 Transcript_90373/m.206635 type:complete len:203 (-) Transcript_90373:1324-1932(-)